MVAVNGRSLGHIPHRLRRVLFDMLLSARIYQIDFQIVRLAFTNAAVRHVPPVDVIVAQILDVG